MHDRLELPEGDMLIHAGDMSWKGEPFEIMKFGAWFSVQPFKHKVVVAGNHDFLFQKNKEYAMELLGPDVHYLQDEAKIIGGKLVYGTPWQPEFHDWAFNATEDSLVEIFSKIPTKVDILVSHGPPFGTCDRHPSGKRIGSVALLDRLKAVKYQLHVTGHVHHSYGVGNGPGGLQVNAASCNEGYNIVNAPIVVHL